MKYIIAAVSFGLCSAAALKEGKANKYSVIEIMAGFVFALGAISC